MAFQTFSLASIWTSAMLPPTQSLPYHLLGKITIIKKPLREFLKARKLEIELELLDSKQLKQLHQLLPQQNRELHFLDRVKSWALPLTLYFPSP